MCLAIPGRVVELTDRQKHLAKVTVAGIQRVVNVGLLRSSPDDDAVGPGDWVLIHVGFAISRVDEEEARRTLEFLEQLGTDFEDELDELRGSDIA